MHVATIKKRYVRNIFTHLKPQVSNATIDRFNRFRDSLISVMFDPNHGRGFFKVLIS